MMTGFIQTMSGSCTMLHTGGQLKLKKTKDRVTDPITLLIIGFSSALSTPFIKF